MQKGKDNMGDHVCTQKFNKSVFFSFLVCSTANIQRLKRLDPNNSPERWYEDKFELSCTM